MFRRLNHLAVVTIVVWLAGFSAVWADIPPPPPTLPGTNISVPRPWAAGIAGLLISAAATSAGFLLVRKRSVATAAVLIGVIGLGITVALVSWSAVEHNRYREVRTNWRSRGPVSDWERPPAPVDGPPASTETKSAPD